MGGVTPGAALNGVMLGSARYIWYTFHRWLSNSVVQRNLVAAALVSRLALLLRLVGVAGIRLKVRGMKGSCTSHSGLVALPPNEVGREVKLLLEEKEASERVEQEDDERCLSQSTCSISSSGDLVCAGGVRGRGPVR